MRVPWIPLLIFAGLSIFSDIYIYKSLATRVKNKLWSKLQLWSAVGCYLVLLCALLLPRKDGDNGMLLTVMWMLYGVASVYLAKFVFVIIDLVSLIPALFGGHRLKFMTKTASVAGVLVFATMWWGALINRFRIDVKEVEIVRTDIPAGFDGYRIVQISDLHTGTYGSDTTFVTRLVDAVNAQEPDLIVFTGDIVNSRSYELTPHAKPLSRLHAKDGVYSIMGNHDYGDYANWNSPAEKAESIEYLKTLQTSMGWKMLNNASEYIYCGGDSIALIGVENIGDPPFPVYGSLSKAYTTLADPTFKVLLTHNPAHWCDSISGREDLNIALSMSGHTHAMQMEIGGYSPAAFRYPTWGGMYADADSTHLLYVNIGAGTVGMPARIGATPEVTVFTFHKTTK